MEQSQLRNFYYDYYQILYMPSKRRAIFYCSSFWSFYQELLPGQIFMLGFDYGKDLLVLMVELHFGQ